jgi:dinuclear metal center YbgI/SA1388 family protein
MVTRNTLLNYCQQLLNPSAFRDYGPNGLQVEGTNEIHHLVTGVTASLALIEKAIDLKAQAILVHHGLFWQGEDPCVVRWKHKRLKALLKHDINLLAYHLPLDAHKLYGNNAQLAQKLGLHIDRWFLSERGPEIGCIGHLPKPLSAEAFGVHLKASLGFAPIVINARQKPMHTIAWCTGAAQSYIEAAALEGVDAYLTGEITEKTLHLAQEFSIDFFAAGHHATERYGACSLGDHLAEHFHLKHTFIDLENPA